jgi:uncharacterized protein involved in outer membrane biogenesis
MANSRTIRRLAWIAAALVSLVLVGFAWNWDWTIPIVQARLSAAIGRPVTIAHLHVQFGRVTQIVADEVTIANPPDWSAPTPSAPKTSKSVIFSPKAPTPKAPLPETSAPQTPDNAPPFLSVHTVTVKAGAWGYIRGHGLFLPLIELDQPSLLAAEAKDGTANYQLTTGAENPRGTIVKIGDLHIVNGVAHVVVPRLKADFTAKIASIGEGDTARITADAKGTYASRPIAFHLVGGALLSLRGASHPWPVDIALTNGPTHITLTGTLLDPLAFKGADLRLQLSGPDMNLLEPLLGLPIPKTAAYQIVGQLDLDGLNKITLNNFTGHLGHSDIAGSIVEQPFGTTDANGKAKPVMTMDLHSNRVDLTDLSGFIGGTPDKSTAANATPVQRQEAANARTSSKVLADTPIDIPHLDWANIHLHYKAEHIQGRNMPLDTLTVVMDVIDGAIAVHPISFSVGKGHLLSNLHLTPTSGRNIHAKMDVHMQNLDLSHMMDATHFFEGAGSISGVGALEATGDSFASLLGRGNGQMKMAMSGGQLSAVLVDLTGLQFANALLSTLGIPHQTQVKCFVGDLTLRRGVVDFNPLVLDTGEGITTVGGTVDMTNETIDLALKTDSKHFSIGSLPTALSVGGTFKNPTFRPGAEAVARAGAIAGLAVLFAPLAILPTIQFGTSDAQDARCDNLLRAARASSGGKALPAPLPEARKPH